MKELQRRQMIKRMVYSIPSLLLLTLVTFFLAKGAVSVLGVERESARTLSGLEEKAETLSLREKELQTRMARIGTEEGLFEEIKEKFSVTRPGERVAIIVDERESAASAGVSLEPWYKRFWTAIMSLYE